MTVNYYYQVPLKGSTAKIGDVVVTTGGTAGNGIELRVTATNASSINTKDVIMALKLFKAYLEGRGGGGNYSLGTDQPVL